MAGDLHMLQLFVSCDAESGSTAVERGPAEQQVFWLAAPEEPGHLQAGFELLLRMAASQELLQKAP